VSGRTGIPKAALQALDEGTVCYLAVSTVAGPHLTPMVYSEHGGRIWLTTSRSSVKAGAWRRSPGVAGMFRLDDMAVTFRGSVTTYDALDPLSWPGAVAGAPRLARAGASFSLKNARFFAGYAVDARKVPLSWSPPGRVFAAVHPASGWVLTEDGPATSWGEWPTGTEFRAQFRRLPSRRSVDLRAPASIRSQVGEAGPGALALATDGGLTVLPVDWRRQAGEGTYDVVLPAARLALAQARRQARAALTIDRASAWRAADMVGMMLQGEAQLFSLEHTTRGRTALRERLGSDDPGLALIRLRPDRAIWWRGWESGTVNAVSRTAS
jgi:Pyridoxamine 5'-phosphate oxidase